MPFDCDTIAFLKSCHLPESRLSGVTALEQLYADLCGANRQVNLTRLTSAEEFWVRHVADSLAIGAVLPEIFQASWRVADVGCGAGFPLLVLAWANPDLRLTGIELKQKKVDFIAAEIHGLGLSNCSVLARQVREVARRSGHREQYDLVLLRAVGTAGDYLKQCRHLLKSGGEARLVFYKTPEAILKERDLARREAEKFGLQISESAVVELPHGAGSRQFLSFHR